MIVPDLVGPLEHSLKDLELHRDLCRECTPFHLCRAGATLLERVTEQLAQRMAPVPKETGAA